MSNRDISIIRQFPELPVSCILPGLTAALGKAHAVLSSPTGSGKTTLIPLALLESSPVSSKKIIMLEPRRIATRAAAVRMSAMLGEKLGTTVGYRTRFESRVSENTRLEVVTEGILIRKLQRDPELHDTGLIIFDEFHERSMQADLGLALCLDLCELRDDLRLLVMSATLDTEKICKLLGNCPAIRSEGKSHPVEVSYHHPLNNQASIAAQMINGIRRAWQESTGDILAFLPGAGEIRQCQRALSKEFTTALLLPLYGNLNHVDQDRVFSNAQGQRRIILSTPIAETSLTIEGISCVVDSGYFRHPVHDQASGLTRLATSRISRASAQQRAGRAGRLGPGHCLRLWSREVEHSLLAHTPPEIINADLTDLVLELALWGVHKPEQLKWMDVPRRSSWDKAVSLLRNLNLLNKDGRINDSGRKVAALPVHPRLGVILCEGAKSGHLWTACLLVAVLSERDFLRKDATTADIESRVRILHEIDSKSGKVARHIDLQFIRRLLTQARQWFKKLSVETNTIKVIYSELGNLLAYGYPDRIAAIRTGTTHRYQLANGRGAELQPADILAGTLLVVAPQVDARKGDGKIFLAAEITMQELLKNHPHLISEHEQIRWDPVKKRVIASSCLKLGKLLLSSKPLQTPDQDKVAKAFLIGLQIAGIEQLPWDREARDIQSRISFLHQWQPENWPNVTDEALNEDLRWLAPYCQNMHRLNQLNSLKVKTILLSQLDWQQQQQLDKLAPSHIQVPSGSRLRLTYGDGEPPVLAVRLQELFGLTDTPRVCNNEIPVLLHLLSPARRPMQITSDLNSFWLNTYPEVRKELAGRYPKHYWPENPIEAEPTTKTKKQMQSASQ